MNDVNVQSIHFNGNDFTNFILFVKSMNSKDKSRMSRVVLLNVIEDKLVCRAIDDASNYIEYNVELINNDNLITETFAVSINDLAALIKCPHSDEFIIRKSFNQFEFNIIGNGWLPFKTVEFDESKFDVSGIETELGTLESSKLRNAITPILGYTQDYTYARDMYIRCNKTQMIATSRLSSVVTSGEFVDMVLHRGNAAMLKTLLKDNFDLKISKIVSSVERLAFTGPKFRFITVASGIDSNNVNYIENINNYVQIDCDELFRLVAFSEEYSASKHIVGMNIKDGCLYISLKNVLVARHLSSIKSVPFGNVENTTAEAEVPAHNLLKALKLFQDKRSKDINIYFTDKLVSSQNCIVIFDKDTQAIINIYNR